MSAPATSAAPRHARPRERLPRGPEGYRWVYLWHVPIRVSHWVAAVSIVVLGVTGYYIGGPFLGTGGEASAHFLMGWMRFLHLAAAGVLVAVAILRVYGLFAGNRYERWSALVPYRKKDWADLFRMAWAYLRAQPEKGPHYLGHNPLQQLSYTGVFALGLVEVVTGFALYGLSNPGGFFFRTFAWVAPLLGGWQMVRLVHHAVLWLFACFIPIHVYLALRADIGEHEGAVSSIISGGRFVREDVTYEDEG